MNMWDQRFGSPGFAYGTEPNAWLAAQACHLRPGGRVLSLGEGEGRNGVWLASRGHPVVAVDGSAVGLAKAARLAAERGVALDAVVTDLAAYQPPAATFDAIVLVFLHLPPPLRVRVHAVAAAALRPGGLVILEAFTPRQLGNASGGPKDPAMLYEPDELRAEFPGVTWEVLREEEVHLAEGPFHQGPARVVRGLGRRTA